MAAALFDPATGYYAARVRTMGRPGDFSTAATLHPALGEAIARWAWARRREVVASGWGKRWHWHAVELGPGGGHLAASFLRALGPWRRLGLTLHLVEVSPALRAVQRERLRPWSGRVRWHGDAAAALRAADGRALVFSNEFVDAFPCRVWEWREGRWREVGLVRPATGGAVPVEQLVPGDPPPGLSSVFEEGNFPPRPAEGQRVETHGRYWDFLACGLAPGWRAGRLLTIDYGDELPALYHRRPRGTLRAYFRHQVLTGAEVYARPGHQDMTADVNFTDLRRWGRELGFAEGDPALQTQAEFLRRWLPGVDRRAAAGGDPALGFLLDSHGAGDAFQVLEQRRPPAPDGG